MPLSKMFFRSESRDVGSNEKLMCFLVHEGKLFYWIKGMTNKIELISELESSKITILDTNEFVYRKKTLQGEDTLKKRGDLDIVKFELVRVKALFSTYEESNFYQETAHKSNKVKSFAIDYKT